MAISPRFATRTLRNIEPPHSGHQDGAGYRADRRCRERRGRDGRCRCAVSRSDSPEEDTVDRQKRSAAPWLFGLAALLALLSPVIFLAVWVAAGDLEGIGVALLAGVADLVLAGIDAVTATVLAIQRGVPRVRTVVHGHPQGRVGRMAEHDAARWHLARRRFGELQA